MIISASPRKTSLSSEVDFSPLTGVSTLHPVPASLDNGMTLDWSGFAANDKSERRWKLSTVRRRETEQLPHLSLVVDQQEKTHSGEVYNYSLRSDALINIQDKITRIKALASPQTLRKAKITSEQLGRRYNLVYGVLSVGSSPLNIARVARWYGSQEPVVRGSLEKAEPFTWLKHLDKHNARPSERSPRHLSALIMEEYIHAQLHHDPMKTIPEDFAVHNSTPDVSISPSLVNSQLFLVPSRASSHYSADYSSTRQQSSEGQISFEPHVRSTRNSLEAESVQSGKSSHSSIISRPSSSAIYPTSTRFQTHDFTPPKKLAYGLDEVSFSPKDYPSVHSELDEYKHEAKSSSVDSRPGSEIKVIISEEPLEVTPNVEPETTRPSLATVLVDDIHEPLPPPSPQSYRHGTTDRAPPRRRGLTSLPPSYRLSGRSESIQQQEADEGTAHEHKTR